MEIEVTFRMTFPSREHDLILQTGCWHCICASCRVYTADPMNKGEYEKDMVEEASIDYEVLLSLWRKLR